MPPSRRLCSCVLVCRRTFPGLNTAPLSALTHALPESSHSACGHFPPPGRLAPNPVISRPGAAAQKQMGWMAPAPGVAAPRWCCHAARAWSHHDGDHDRRPRPGQERLSGSRDRQHRRSGRPALSKTGSGDPVLQQAPAVSHRHGGVRHEPSLGARAGRPWSRGAAGPRCSAKAPITFVARSGTSFASPAAARRTNARALVMPLGMAMPNSARSPRIMLTSWVRL